MMEGYMMKNLTATELLIMKLIRASKKGSPIGVNIYMGRTATMYLPILGDDEKQIYKFFYSQIPIYGDGECIDATQKVLEEGEFFPKVSKKAALKRVEEALKEWEHFDKAEELAQAL